MTHMDQTPSRVNVLVLGEVQGVFFRASALEQAQSLRVSGWVKNLSDGTVEVLAEGPRYALTELVEWCKHGPPAAKVEDIIVRWESPKGEFRTFMIAR